MVQDHEQQVITFRAVIQTDSQQRALTQLKWMMGGLTYLTFKVIFRPGGSFNFSKMDYLVRVNDLNWVCVVDFKR